LGTVTGSRQPSEGDTSEVAVSEKRARKERIDRLMEEVHESLAKTDAVFDKWEAEGFLRRED